MERIENIFNCSIIEHLESYNPTNDDEIKYKQQMLDFYSEFGDYSFDRSNTNGHFTASSWIMTEDGERVLITHHKKLGLKLQLGGHCDGDTNVLRVAIRETIEESGIKNIIYSNSIFDIDVHLIPSNKTTKSHLHYDVRFLVIVPNNSEYIVSDESDALEWITKDYDCSECTYGFKRMMQKWKNIDTSNYTLSIL